MIITCLVTFDADNNRGDENAKIWLNCPISQLDS